MKIDNSKFTAIVVFCAICLTILMQFIYINFFYNQPKADMVKLSVSDTLHFNPILNHSEIKR